MTKISTQTQVDEDVLTSEQSAEKGATLIEILISMLLLTITGMGVTMSMSTSLKTTKYTEYNHMASSLATSKMELLASLNVSFLTTGHAGVESNVTWPNSNATFTRTTTVTVNADGSRTVSVTVTPNDDNYDTTVVFENTFAIWE